MCGFSLAVAEITSRHDIVITQSHVLVGLIAGLAVLVGVLMQYESMSLLSRLLLRINLQPRRRILIVMLGMLVLHTVEVWMFAALYYVLDGRGALGYLDGPIQEGALDYVHFSVVTYTSLGLGELVPHGPLRILAGTEALLGLSLITWTASFAFLEMQRDWAEYRRSVRG